MKKLSILFTALAVALSDVMCAVVAYNYSSLSWCGRFGECSAPASSAFLLAIPFGIGIAVCAGLAVVFHRKAG